MADSPDGASGFDIELQTIHRGYDRKTCWFHARGGVIPSASGEPAIAIVATQKWRIERSDVFYELNDLRSDDGGRTWGAPVSHGETLGRRNIGEQLEEGVCDFTPTWHAKTGVMLGTGHTVVYKEDGLVPYPRPRRTIYSSYDPVNRRWSAWRKLDSPDEPRFFGEGAGCTQRVDLPNGEILLPTYFTSGESMGEDGSLQHWATVMRCAFDGQTLRYVEHGTELTLPRGRGFVEPSLATARGRYFLTLRNNDGAYVAVSRDGLHYDAPRPWVFDDGGELGSYNTQQHWIIRGKPGEEELYLAYTRRGAGNDHVFRHRAPLFVAKVDLDRLVVLRATERVAIPDRGAQLGNFGTVHVSDNESWVVASEGMHPYRCTFDDLERRGSDGCVFVAKLRWR